MFCRDATFSPNVTIPHWVYFNQPLHVVQMLDGSFDVAPSPSQHEEGITQGHAHGEENCHHLETRDGVVGGASSGLQTRNDCHHHNQCTCDGKGKEGAGGGHIMAMGG